MVCSWSNVCVITGERLSLENSSQNLLCMFSSRGTNILRYTEILCIFNTIILWEHACSFELCACFRRAFGQLRQIMPSFHVLFIFPLKNLHGERRDLILMWIKINVNIFYSNNAYTRLYTNNNKDLHQSLVPLLCLLSGDISDTQLWWCAFTLVWTQVLHIAWLWTKLQRRQTVNTELVLFMLANARGFGDHKYIVCWY